MAEDRGGPAPLWGVSAEFETADGMVAALDALHGQGLGRLDGFSPVPVPAAAQALRMPRRSLRPLALLGMLAGGAAMFGMCTYATVWSYRFNIGGRPLFSWQSFVVPSFSFAMMTGTLAAVGALLVLSRLPRLNHPAFNIPGFTRATSDRFFVAVEAEGDGFDPDRVERLLSGLALRPARISRVPR